MKSRTYATRFLLIMTAILGFTAAQGPIYAGDLSDCLAILETAKDCYKCPNTGDLKTVTVEAFPGHDVQCDITREPGNATLTLIAQTTGFIGAPRSRVRRCSVDITGLGACPGPPATAADLSRSDYAAWAVIVREECKAAM